jgi:hypothetical protein
LSFGNSNNFRVTVDVVVSSNPVCRLTQQDTIARDNGCKRILALVDRAFGQCDAASHHPQVSLSVRLEHLDISRRPSNRTHRSASDYPITAANGINSQKYRSDHYMKLARDGSAAGDKLAKYENVANVLAHGPTRTTVVLRSGLQVDLRVVPKASYGAALM